MIFKDFVPPPFLASSGMSDDEADEDEEEDVEDETGEMGRGSRREKEYGLWGTAKLYGFPVQFPEYWNLNANPMHSAHRNVNFHEASNSENPKP